MAQALARWRHPVALSEAPDVLHRAMRPVSYRRIRMAASKSPAFFVVIILLFEHNLSLRQWYGQHKLKPNYIILCSSYKSIHMLWVMGARRQ